MTQHSPHPDALHALAALLRLEGPYTEGHISNETYWAAYETARTHFGDTGMEYSANYFTSAHSTCEEIAAVADDPDHLHQLAHRMLTAPNETAATIAAATTTPH